MSEDGADRLFATLHHLTKITEGVQDSPHFTEKEKEILLQFGQDVWHKGSYLALHLSAYAKNGTFEDDDHRPSIDDLRKSLEEIVVASFNIGSASWLRDSTRRFLKSEAGKSIREAREKLNARKKAIINEVLSDLVPKGASTYDIKDEIVAKFRAKKIDTKRPPAPRTIERWVADFRKRSS